MDGTFGWLVLVSVIGIGLFSLFAWRYYLQVGKDLRVEALKLREEVEALRRDRPIVLVALEEAGADGPVKP